MAKALDPVVFKTYVQMFDILLRARKNDFSATTRRNYSLFGGRFVAWLDEQDEPPSGLTSKRQAALARAYINGPIGDLAWRSRKFHGSIIHLFFWFLAGGRDGEGLEQYQVVPEPPKWKVSTIVKDEHDIALCPKPEELNRLLEYLRDEGDLYYLTFALVASSAALRRTEACNLTWHDLTFAADGSQVEIVVHKGKGKKDRRTIGNASAAAALLALRESREPERRKDGSFVFGGYKPIKDKTGKRTGGFEFQPPDPDDISDHFIQFSKRLSKPDDEVHITAHSLRHYASHVMIEQGLTPVDIKNVLGHSSLTTTQRYIDIEAATTLKKLAAINTILAQNSKVVDLKPHKKRPPKPVATLAA